MSNTERYQNLSKKRPQKNYRDGFGDYCCISGFQSVFYDANRIKTGISHFKLSEDPALCKKCLQVIKRYRRTGGADKFSKTKKVMVCEFHLNSKQIRVSLGIGKRHICQEVYRRCLILNLKRRKKKENLPSHVIIKKHLVNLKLNLNL